MLSSRVQYSDSHGAFELIHRHGHDRADKGQGARPTSFGLMQSRSQARRNRAVDQWGRCSYENLVVGWDS